jgi:hypothetical protein
VPDALEPFRLAGRAAIVDQALLAQLLTDPGVTWLAALVEAALASTAAAVVAGSQRHRLIAGLISCLPPECRTEFSFSTGLKYSPRRPFRLIGLGDDPVDQRRLLRQYEITVLELSDKPPKQFTALDGWGGFIACAIATGRSAFLSSQFSQPRRQKSLAELDTWGNQLLETLAESSDRDQHPPASPQPIQQKAGHSPPSPSHEAEARPAPADEAPAAACVADDDDQRRADAPHTRFERQAASKHVAPAGIAEDPAQVLGRQCPNAVRMLELLDDTVFEAIAGKPAACEQLRVLWPELLATLGRDLIEESREQYIRHALRVWQECIDGDSIRNPATAIAAMEVVCLLFNR